MFNWATLLTPATVCGSLRSPCLGTVRSLLRFDPLSLALLAYRTCLKPPLKNGQVTSTEGLCMEPWLQTGIWYTLIFQLETKFALKFQILSLSQIQKSMRVSKTFLFKWKLNVNLPVQWNITKFWGRCFLEWINPVYIYVDFFWTPVRLLRRQRVICCHILENIISSIVKIYSWLCLIKAEVCSV